MDGETKQTETDNSTHQSTSHVAYAIGLAYQHRQCSVTPSNIATFTAICTTNVWRFQSIHTEATIIANYRNHLIIAQPLNRNPDKLAEMTGRLRSYKQQDSKLLNSVCVQSAHL